MPPSTPKPTQRIAKLLARAGIASRREIERMIADGRIAINGKVLDTPATLLGSLDGVTVDGNPVEAPAPARLYLYHKPPGLLVTERDPAGRPTIYDRLPRDLPRLVPVGRLDLNTEGLLLLTTDGELKRQLELPATGVERSYRARAYGPVTQAQLEELIEGVEIEGIRYGSINANLERRTGANTWIEMTLKEGKNREVRRVLEFLGLQVSRLIRTRYGPFVLGDLPAGEIGEVRQHDVIAFRNNPTRNPPPEKPQERRGAQPAPRRSSHEPRARSTATPERAHRTAAAPPAAAKPKRWFKAPSPDGAKGSDKPPRAGPPARKRDGQPAAAKSARAARAAAHRDAREPRAGDLVDKPRRPGPAAGRGAPRPGGKPRPPRRRK